MIAYFDEKGNPKIKVIASGRKFATSIDAFFDTGCSGHLVLPISLAVQLGLELIGIEPVQYADGRVTNELVFKVLVKINGDLKAVPATLTEGSQPLIGIGLCDGYLVNIDFRDKKIEISKKD